MKRNTVESICLYCGYSGVTDEDELYCSLKQKVVKDEDTCEDYN